MPETRAQELHARKIAHDATKSEDRKPDKRKSKTKPGKGKGKGKPAEVETESEPKAKAGKGKDAKEPTR